MPEANLIVSWKVQDGSEAARLPSSHSRGHCNSPSSLVRTQGAGDVLLISDHQTTYRHAAATYAGKGSLTACQLQSKRSHLLAS